MLQNINLLNPFLTFFFFFFFFFFFVIQKSYRALLRRFEHKNIYYRKKFLTELNEGECSLEFSNGGLSLLARTLLQIMNVVDLRNGEKIFDHIFAS